MGNFNKLESSLNRLFNSPAVPKLSASTRNTIALWLPWLSLAGALVTVIAGYNLWRWADIASGLAGYANDLSRSLGGPEIVSDRFTIGIWIGLALLLLQAVLLLAAVRPLRNMRRTGWKLLFYGLLISVLYGVLLLFTDYGVLGAFLGSLAGLVVAFWLIFQVQEKYKA